MPQQSLKESLDEARKLTASSLWALRFAWSKHWLFIAGLTAIALANGLLCRFDPNWIAFGPPLVSTAEQIEEMAAIFEQSLGETLASL